MIDLNDPLTELGKPTQPGPVARCPLDRPDPSSLWPFVDDLDEELVVALLRCREVTDRARPPEAATSAAV